MMQLKQRPQRTLCCPHSGGTGRGKASPSPSLGLWAAAGGSYPTFGRAEWGGQFGGGIKNQVVGWQDHCQGCLARSWLLHGLEGQEWNSQAGLAMQVLRTLGSPR